jgi:S-adenosylmethionine/arginine decarboxylase-like enzyme
MNNKSFTSETISEQEYSSQKAWGLLATINLYGCDHSKIIDTECMKDFIKVLCKEIDMIPHGEPRIEKFAEGHLEGYSVLQFIETSSITIHFDDKIGDRAFIDIFSCKYFDTNKALEFCKNYFSAKDGLMNCIIRN